MNKHILIFVVLSLLLPSCTVGRYTLENKIKPVVDVPRTKNITTPKQVTFKIKFDGRTYFERPMPQSYSKDEKQYWIDRYTKTTKQVLADNNYKPVEVLPEDEAEPDLNIKIIECPLWNGISVGNENLTWYSLGLIPSWATRNKQCFFKLTDLRNGKKHTYWIDDHRFHHLLMLLCSWTVLLVDDSADKYEEALQNFIEYVIETDYSLVLLSDTANKILQDLGLKVEGTHEGVDVVREGEIETVTFTPPVIMSDGMTTVIKIDHKNQGYWVIYSGGIGGGRQETGPFRIKR